MFHIAEQFAALEIAIINPFLKTIISPWLIYIKCCLNWRQSTYKDINYMQSHYIFRTAVIENHSEEKSWKVGSVKEAALPYILCETAAFFPQHICFYCNKVWFNNHHEYFIGRTLSPPPASFVLLSLGAVQALVPATQAALRSHRVCRASLAF